jgi:branched-subunit amino acid transport protein AzlD
MILIPAKVRIYVTCILPFWIMSRRQEHDTIVKASLPFYHIVKASLPFWIMSRRQEHDT